MIIHNNNYNSYFYNYNNNNNNIIQRIIIINCIYKVLFKVLKVLKPGICLASETDCALLLELMN